MGKEKGKETTKRRNDPLKAISNFRKKKGQKKEYVFTSRTVWTQTRGPEGIRDWKDVKKGIQPRSTGSRKR